MKTLITILLLTFGMSPLVFANAGSDSQSTYENLERVDRISLFNGLYAWSNVDDDSIIVWATPFRPFLVDLSRKSHDLRFTNTIALTSSAGQIYEKFDSVIVDGIRYPIKRIYKLDRASAKSMRKNS